MSSLSLDIVRLVVWVLICTWTPASHRIVSHHRLGPVWTLCTLVVVFFRLVTPSYATGFSRRSIFFTLALTISYPPNTFVHLDIVFPVTLQLRLRMLFRYPKVSLL